METPKATVVIVVSRYIYAVYNPKIRLYKVCKLKMKQYARREGVSPSYKLTIILICRPVSYFKIFVMSV